MTSGKLAEKLKAEARQAAEFRGHILGPWSGTAGTDLAYCKTCRCQVAVTPEPAPNGAPVAGRALAIDCTSQQESVRLAFTSYGHLLEPSAAAAYTCFAVETYAEFAEKIRASYDLANMRNWAVYYAVRYRGSDLLPDVFRIR